MKALFLAGGFGTRLREVVSDVPKSMALFAGKPFLEHQIAYLKKQGINEVILGVHYMSDKIKSYFGTGHRFGVDLTYSDEDVPLGTGGAIKNAQRYLEKEFLVLNGDSYSNLDLKSFLEFHRRKESEFSMVLTEIEEGSQYGKVILEKEKIKDFVEKGKSEGGLINGGIYLFSPKVFDFIESGKNVSLERTVFPELIRNANIYGYVHEGYFMDIGRPETYNQFKRDVLETLVMREEDSFRKAMQKITDNGIDIILVADDERKLIGVANNKIIREYLLGGGNLEDELEKGIVRDPITGLIGDDEGISKLLFGGINHLPVLDKGKKICDVRFRNEEIKQETFPTISGKSPLRISFAGGGTDLPDFFEEHGGAVISSTVDKYCHVTAQKRADSKVFIRSDMTEKEIVFDSRKIAYDDEFDIVKSVFKLVNPGFGVDFYLRNDVPPGRGLGSSASFAVLMAKVLHELGGTKYDEHNLAEIAYRAEVDELKIRGGKQDQYAAVVGGFNWMEFDKGDKKIIYPLRIREDVMNELEEHLTLYYTGNAHNSREQHENQRRSFEEGREKTSERLKELKKIAVEIKENFLSPRPDFLRVGQLMHESWQYKRSLAGELSNGNIDRIYELGMKNSAYGGKLLGSGGGGYILFFHHPKKRNQLERALKEDVGEILNFNFESRGTQTWFSR